ncbi:hypothetical protein F5X71_08350 [Nocardia brasiliensis]|uniref:Uncharacterized protein n=1 Tax=Nocardia brasiliensis TaxID=37326 RepID=A0A6G9XN11_NOCBR|nr:hypothetical protein [Nocardia brasiliensis]QIS02331.1 hypothetical protein F5X71_08350 [Nocardia brasiliensis]
MSAPADDADRLWSDYQQIAEVRDLFDDIDAAAWASMERKNFADSTAEIAKLAQIKGARAAVGGEVKEVFDRYLEASARTAPVDEITAAVEDLSRRRRRGIERSR